MSVDQREQDTRPHGLVDKVNELVHEGNVRRIIIKDEAGYAVIEIPVMAGVVVAVVAPVVAAVGAVAALANDWHIEIEHS